MHIYIFIYPYTRNHTHTAKLYNFLIYLDISKENPILYQHICWRMLANLHKNFYILN